MHINLYITEAIEKRKEASEIDIQKIDKNQKKRKYLKKVCEIESFTNKALMESNEQNRGY